jgi:hypothetical protein
MDAAEICQGANVTGSDDVAEGVSKIALYSRIELRVRRPHTAASVVSECKLGSRAENTHVLPGLPSVTVWLMPVVQVHTTRSPTSEKGNELIDPEDRDETSRRKCIITYLRLR